MTLTTSFGDFQRFGGRKFCQELGLVSVMCEELRHIFQPLDKPDGTSSFFRGWKPENTVVMVQKSCVHQLRLVVYLLIHEVLCMAGVVQDFWNINSIPELAMIAIPDLDER